MATESEKQEVPVQFSDTRQRIGMFTLAIIWSKEDAVGKRLDVHASGHGEWPDGSFGQGLLVNALEGVTAQARKRFNDLTIKERVLAELKAEKAKLEIGVKNEEVTKEKVLN